jgi:hypothetical protein
MVSNPFGPFASLVDGVDGVDERVAGGDEPG